MYTYYWTYAFYVQCSAMHIIYMYIHTHTHIQGGLGTEPHNIFGEGAGENICPLVFREGVCNL